MTADYCRDPDCRQPVESELWGVWCSLRCAHRWIWRQRVDWIEPDPQTSAPTRPQRSITRTGTATATSAKSEVASGTTASTGTATGTPMRGAPVIGSTVSTGTAG